MIIKVTKKMTKKEVIKEVKNYENYPNGLSKECRNYIIKALEQETVSRESYEHEYFLRKEFEIKIDKLQRQLEEQTAKVESVIDKIRTEIVDLGQRAMNDNRANGIWACIDIIDKYRAECEETK